MNFLKLVEEDEETTIFPNPESKNQFLGSLKLKPLAIKNQKSVNCRLEGCPSGWVNPGLTPLDP